MLYTGFFIANTVKVVKSWGEKERKQTEKNVRIK
jgi:hypothetical protein